MACVVIINQGSESLNESPKATELVSDRSHTCSCISSSVMGPEDTDVENTQSMQRGDRCASIKLWYHVITCAIIHTQIWEVTELSSQGLLNHRNPGSNFSSATYKLGDPEQIS